MAFSTPVNLVVIAVLAVSIVSYAAVPKAGAQPADTTAGDSSVDVTVMTYNIRVGLGANGTREGDEPEWRLQGIADLIRSHGADVVLLQEVDNNRSRSGRLDEAAFLADALGYEHRYAPAIVTDEGQEYGIAILSRWPISSEKVTELYQPDYSDHEPELPGYYNEQRLAQEVAIRAPFGTMTAINTHLGLTYEQRVRQLEEIGQIVEQRISEGPVVLGGDFNSQPDAPSLLPVRKRLRDAYLFHRNENGLIRHMPIVDRRTFPAHDPERCIDYIFVSDGSLDVLETVVPITTLSDHLPVITRLSVEE